MGIPQNITIELSLLNGSNVFVESGTLYGDTTRWASGHFQIVHTIERAKVLYDLHSCELAKLNGVTPHLGDSRTIFPEIVKNLGEQRATHWLDGHWSGGRTAGKYDECPIIDELKALSYRDHDIILIDDARLFLAAPPLPHDFSQWPTITDIVNALPERGERQYIQVVDDVIFIIPKEGNLQKHLISYAQNRSNEFWKEFSKLQRGKGSSHKR